MIQRAGSFSRWADDAVFYHIYPLGLCGAPAGNDLTTPPARRLEAIYEWSGHLSWLGINALYLGPLFESGSHGYDTVDYEHVDRRLGDNDLLRELVDHLHHRGIKVILDAVFNHVGRGFFAFRDLLEHRESSRYVSWFSGLRFDESNPFGDPFTYDTWDGHFELVKLALGNPEVVAYLNGVARHWIDAFGIDGLRLDAANVMDLGFLRDLSTHCRAHREDFWLLGEVVAGDYRRWAHPGILDSVTNYEAYKGLYSSHNDGNYFEIAYTLKRQFGKEGLYGGIPLYNFADNHDVDRVASALENPAHLYPLSILLFTMPGVPSLYYGSEWGIEGRRLPHTDAPLRPELTPHAAYTISQNRDLVHTCRRLIALRNGCAALRRGAYRELHVSHRQLAFSRNSEEGCCIVAVNSDSERATLELALPDSPEGTWRDVLNDGELLPVRDGRLRLSLHPNWGAILVDAGHN